MTFLEWLQIIFIVLKLCGKISWSWWIVCIPIVAHIVFQIIFGIIKAREEARNPENLVKKLFGGY